jgi:hypothetical protein
MTALHQLDLFAIPTPARKDTPTRKVKLISQGRTWAFPTGFTARPEPRQCSYETPDRRWVVEANWWAGGKWCVFDMNDATQRDEAHRRLIRCYYEPGIPYTEQPIPADAGTVVKTLDEAKELIAAAT